MNSESILVKIPLRRPCNIAELRNWIMNNVGDHENWVHGVQIITKYPTDHHLLFNTEYVSEEFITMVRLKYG